MTPGPVPFGPAVDDLLLTQRAEEGRTLWKDVHIRRCPMRVLLATDFSSGAEIARDLAADITWPYASHIRIAHALESTPRLVAFTSYALVEDGSRENVERELHRTVEALKRPSYTVDSVV